MMSLRWRFFGAFVLIIVLVVSLSVGVGYYMARAQLDGFVAELGRVEANSLVQNLSRAYTSSGDWSTLEIVLYEAGYLYDEEMEHDAFGEHEWESGEDGSEFFHIDRIRVVIVDVQEIVIQDNFSELEPGEVAPELGGQRTTVVDLRTDQPVGYAFVDVNREFLATESLGFLRELLFGSVIGGPLVAAIALLLAAWLSRRITAPVTALTRATQAIAQHGDSALLPVTSSDELGQMNVAFNQMTAALQTQRDLRQRLINDVSHELNTPLSFIRLEATGLRDGLQPPTRAADNIIQEVSVLSDLMHDLSWLAETDSGELRLTAEPYSIHQLLTSEVERWQPQAQAHQIALLLEPLPELPMLNLDRMRMSQAIGNIVHNALQHTEADGSVTVAVSQYAGRTVEISVTDDGVGIDSADLPHVFNRFYRTDQSRSRVTGGTGLGLAIARAIIEAHNGTIAITSDGLDQGATVRFNLPPEQMIPNHDPRAVFSVGFSA